MGSDTFDIILLPPGNDDDFYTAESQSDLRAFHSSLQDAGFTVSPHLFFRDAAGAGVSFVGEFAIPLAQVVGPTLGVILVAWIQGRSGRKLRLKVGDIEAEARTPAEIEQLLQQAAKLQDRAAASKDDAQP